jgi:sarcosine oxidase subunit alpha
MTPHSFTVQIDGRLVVVTPGTTVAAAVWNAGMTWFRTSAGGEPRGPVCGMGICFECRVTVDGAPHRRACMLACAPGMTIETGGGVAAGAGRPASGAAGRQAGGDAIRPPGPAAGRPGANATGRRPEGTADQPDSGAAGGPPGGFRR